MIFFKKNRDDNEKEDCNFSLIVGKDTYKIKLSVGLHVWVEDILNKIHKLKDEKRKSTYFFLMKYYEEDGIIPIFTAKRFLELLIYEWLQKERDKSTEDQIKTELKNIKTLSQKILFIIVGVYGGSAASKKFLTLLITKQFLKSKKNPL